MTEAQEAVLDLLSGEGLLRIQRENELTQPEDSGRKVSCRITGPGPDRPCEQPTDKEVGAGLGERGLSAFPQPLVPA